ncbi:MAG: hypothetical protein WCP29_01825 [Acidobacteriota bacterium]
MFDKELEFFIANQDRLVAEHRNQFLILRGPQVVGVYPTLLDAYVEALRRFAPGTFMLQRCEPGPDAYTVTISTRDLFATMAT